MQPPFVLSIKGAGPKSWEMQMDDQQNCAQHKGKRLVMQLMRNEEGLTFRQWSAAVDRILVQCIGLTQGDLSDWCSYDAWEDQLSPLEGAYACCEDDDLAVSVLYLLPEVL